MFRDLGLVGDRRGAPVRRRAEGEAAPDDDAVDVLAMTATPIPRTLNL
jgi:RecG-like helicase